ncbi:DUF3558 family protein [Nocardia sp. NPDC004711]
MRAAGAVAGIALIGAAIAGCGGSSNQRAAPATTTSRAAVMPAPNTIGLCGGVADADVGQATGLNGLQRVAVNPLGCAWQRPAGGDYAVVFHWFRGSPLADRRTQITDARPSDVQVGGQSGIEWQGPQSCEVALPFGDSDFIDWSERAAITETAKEPCKGLEQLAASTLTKAGQG